MAQVIRRSIVGLFEVAFHGLKNDVVWAYCSGVYLLVDRMVAAAQ